MSNITALKMIIEYRSTESYNVQNRFMYMRENHPSYINLDWEEAEKWIDFIEIKNINNDLQIICREVAEIFILHSSVLLELAAHGREVLISNLNDDEIQVFRNGGLLEKHPSTVVVSWWDNLKHKGRTKHDEKLLVQGREAERWTFELEMKKNVHLGNEYHPIWVALDSDHYGYDILSYIPSSQLTPTAILIEVKSFSNPSNPHFYLTKNEWDKAIDAENNYLFVIWCVSTKSYKIYTPNQIEPHISKNSGHGAWQNILISINDW